MRIALFLQRLGLSSDLLHSLGFASVAGSLALWGRSGRSRDDAAKARAERGAIFVGLWPPTLFLLGKVLQDPSGRRTSRPRPRAMRTPRSARSRSEPRSRPRAD